MKLDFDFINFQDFIQFASNLMTIIPRVINSIKSIILIKPIILIKSVILIKTTNPNLYPISPADSSHSTRHS